MYIIIAYFLILLLLIQMCNDYNNMKTIINILTSEHDYDDIISLDASENNSVNILYQQN